MRILGKYQNAQCTDKCTQSVYKQGLQMSCQDYSMVGMSHLETQWAVSAQVCENGPIRVDLAICQRGHKKTDSKPSVQTEGE